MHVGQHLMFSYFLCRWIGIRTECDLKRASVLWSGQSMMWST